MTKRKVKNTAPKLDLGQANIVMQIAVNGKKLVPIRVVKGMIELGSKSMPMPVKESPLNSDVLNYVLRVMKEDPNENIAVRQNQKKKVLGDLDFSEIDKFATKLQKRKNIVTERNSL